MKVISLTLILLLCSCSSTQKPDKNLLSKKANWQISNYGSGGTLEFVNNTVNLEMGDPIQGMHWMGPQLPTSNYKLSLDAMRTQGNDFFVGLTFPVKDQFCSLIISGWGGTVTGLSSINDLDASNNESTCDVVIKNQQWYNIELVVQDKFIKVYVDGKEIILTETLNKKFSIRPEVEPSKPLGLATFYTSAKYRNFYLKTLD